jgi:hypothetical protein
MSSRVPCRTLRFLRVAVALSVAGAGCAKGGGGGTGRTDAGGGADAARPDGGQPDGMMPRDGGGGADAARDGAAACTDDMHPAMCDRAEDLGSLEPGAVPVLVNGVIPVVGGEDWFRVAFPYRPTAPSMMGGGAPHIELTINEGGYFFEVRARCAAAMACGGRGEPSTMLSEWDFVDDQSMPGETQWSTRDVEWPNPLYIKVYRPMGGAVSCPRYQLTVSR